MSAVIQAHTVDTGYSKATVEMVISWLIGSRAASIQGNTRLPLKLSVN